MHEFCSSRRWAAFRRLDLTNGGGLGILALTSIITLVLAPDRHELPKVPISKTLRHRLFGAGSKASLHSN